MKIETFLADARRRKHERPERRIERRTNLIRARAFRVGTAVRFVLSETERKSGAERIASGRDGAGSDGNVVDLKTGGTQRQRGHDCLAELLRRLARAEMRDS